MKRSPSPLALWFAFATGGCGLLVPLSGVDRSVDAGTIETDSDAGNDVGGGGNGASNTRGGNDSGGTATSPGGNEGDAGDTNGVGGGGATAVGGAGSGGNTAGGAGGTGGAGGCTGAGCEAMGDACEDGDGRCLAVPEGWDGPVVVQRGAGGAPTAECPEPFSDLLLDVHYAEPSAEPFACNSCSCTSSDTDCELTIRTASNGCAAAPDPPTTVNPGECFGLGTGPGLDILFDGVPETTGAVCSGPVGGAITDRPTPTWARSIFGCAPSLEGPDADCGSADTCVPKSNPFDSALCVFAAGELTCPSGFSDRELYYEDFTDSRSCQACACEMTGDCRGPDVVVGYVDAACGTPSLDVWSECPDTTMPPMPPCTCLTLAVGAELRAVRYEPTAECSATGGTAIGGVTPDSSSAVTVCCEP